MLQRAFYTSVAAILLSATLVQTAAAIAYPATATTSRTTVTGVYNPLNLEMELAIDGVNTLNFTPGGTFGSSLSFEADYSGTFFGTGASGSSSGPSGIWRVLLSDVFESVSSYNDGGLFLTAPTGVQVGTLTYIGGLIDITGLDLPYADTPKDGDVFRIMTTGSGPQLRVACNGGVDANEECHDFDLELLQVQRLEGPYFDKVLDTERKCVPTEDITCDGFTLTARGRPTSVPEPATLALLGMGLAGLGLFRRPRQV